MGIIDTIGHTLMDNDALHFSTVQAQFLQEQWLVTLSAPLSAFNGDYINAIETGKDNDTLRDGVAEIWNVRDRDSFEDVALWLTDEGHRSRYQALWLAISAVDTAALTTNALLRAVMEAWFPSFFQMKASRTIGFKAMAALNKEAENVPALLNASRSWVNALRKNLDISPGQIPNLVAWDAVRLVSLSHWAVQLGFIDRTEFGHYAGALADEVRRTYTGWQQVSAAYIAGGLIWKHTDAREENLLRTNRLLLSDPRSPYKTVRFTAS